LRREQVDQTCQIPPEPRDPFLQTQSQSTDQAE